MCVCVLCVCVCTEVPLNEALHTNEDLIENMEWDKPCPGCGILLLDADKSWDLEALNKRLRDRSAPVSVCVLRSKTKCPRDITTACTRNVQAFEELVTRWGGKGAAVANTRQGGSLTILPEASDQVAHGHHTQRVFSPLIRHYTKTDKAEIFRRLRDGVPFRLTPRSWAVDVWCKKAERFHEWWKTVVDKPFLPNTTYPFFSSLSVLGRTMSESAMVSAMKKEYKDVRRNATPHEVIQNVHYAVLVGGTGSPPHFDTFWHLSSNMIQCTDAVGIIIQGCKFFHAVPPNGTKLYTFEGFFRHREPCGRTDEHDQVRRDLANGVTPRVFQGTHCLGWPSIRQWREYGIENCNHFHALLPGDIYIVVAGAWHCVVNHRQFIPVSVANDQEWIGRDCIYDRLWPRQTQAKA